MNLDAFNPKGMALKKFMHDILQTKYPPHEDIIERIASSLLTGKDLMSYSKMVSDVYEAGYLKAVKDYKEQLADLGLNVNVVTKRTQE